MTLSPSFLVRPLLLTGLAAVLIGLVGCDGDYRPDAIGKEGEITVVMDSSHWTGPVGDAFRDNVTPWIETLPQPERYFDIRHLELSTERTYEDVQRPRHHNQTQRQGDHPPADEGGDVRPGPEVPAGGLADGET